MAKSILIFGGGANQVTLIKAANELTVKSIVIDPNPDAPGKTFADVFEVVAPNDYEKTKLVALQYKVDGIVTSQMENPLRLMARLANELGFIFPSPEVIENARDKYRMKRVFIKHAIPCAQGTLFQKDKAISNNELEGLQYPLIVKPCDAHSSRGVFKVNDINEITKYRPLCEHFSTDGSIIVEEFLEGDEFSIEAVTFQGKTNIIQYTEKIITPYPYTVEMGHKQPANLTEIQKDKIKEVVCKAIAALGIDNSVTHTELKLTEYGPKIIEIGARLGGDFISSYLTLSSTGVNMDKAAIQIALGLKPDTTPTIHAGSVIKYLQLPTHAQIKEILPWQGLLDESGVVTAGITVQPQDIIPAITHSAARPGYVLVTAETVDKAEQLSDKYLAELKNCIQLV